MKKKVVPEAPPVDRLEQIAGALAAEAPPAAAPAPAAEAPPEAAVPVADLLRPLLRFAFDSLAPAWWVTDDELSHLADAYGAVLDKYFPDGFARFGVEVNALLLTAAVIGPRLKLPRQAAPPPYPAPPAPDAPADGG